MYSVDCNSIFCVCYILYFTEDKDINVYHHYTNINGQVNPVPQKIIIKPTEFLKATEINKIILQFYTYTRKLQHTTT